MYKLNFNHLYYFLSIANEGSIVKASKKLNLTQPALSHQLKQLESDLGKRLFERKGRRLVLNEQGKKLKIYASRIFRTAEDLLIAMEKDSPQVYQSIKIGLVPWVSKESVNRLLKKLYYAENVQIKFVAGGIDFLLQELSNKKLDLIVSDSDFRGRFKNIVVKRQLERRKIVCVSSREIKSTKKFPNKLNGLEYMGLASESQFSEKVERLLQSHNINLIKKMEFDDSSQLLSSLSNTRSVSFVFEDELKSVNPSLKIKKIGELTQDFFPVFLLTTKEKRKDFYIKSLFSTKV
jgi:LysR family transcriptional activator of nhaA